MRRVWLRTPGQLLERWLVSAGAVATLGDLELHRSIGHPNVVLHSKRLPIAANTSGRCDSHERLGGSSSVSYCHPARRDLTRPSLRKCLFSATLAHRRPCSVGGSGGVDSNVE